MSWRPIGEARRDGTMYVVRGVTREGTMYDGDAPYIAWWEPAIESYGIRQEAHWTRHYGRPGYRPQPKCVCYPDEFFCEVPNDG